MTRVVSSKLSNVEHEMLLSEANLQGKSVSEFVRDLIINSLKGTNELPALDESTKQLQTLAREFRNSMAHS